MNEQLAVNHVHLNQQGIEMFLGKLETEIMRAVWAGFNTLPKIHRQLRATYNDNISYSTITTIVRRLVEKGMLVRYSDGTQPNIYTSPYTNEDRFIEACITDLFFVLIAEHGMLAKRCFYCVEIAFDGV